jgi:hypothetical protein
MVYADTAQRMINRDHAANFIRRPLRVVLNSRRITAVEIHAPMRSMEIFCIRGESNGKSIILPRVPADFSDLRSKQFVLWIGIFQELKIIRIPGFSRAG